MPTTSPRGSKRASTTVVQNLKEPAVAVNDALQGERESGLAISPTACGKVDGGGLPVSLMWPPNWGCRRTRPISARRSLFGASEKAPLSNCLCLVPSNARDTVGTAVDMALNPLTFVGGAPATYAGVATGSANVVDTRSQHLHDLDELERNSLDYYATLRSVYRQHRDAEISAAKQPAPEGQVDISFPNTRP